MERETRLQIVVSSVVVVAFVGVLAALGATFSSNGGISETGGYALVGALVAFVFVLSGAGLLITSEDGEDT